MRSYTYVLAATVDLTGTVIRLANAQITGQHVYNDGDGSREQNHVAYHIDGLHTCGVLVENATHLTLQQSTIDGGDFFGEAHLPSAPGSPLLNALVCATDQSDLFVDHTALEFSKGRTSGIWTSGLNTTAHVSNFRLTSHASESWGLIATNQSAIIASNIEYDSEDQSNCGFVAAGGALSIDNSVAYADGLYSAGLCVMNSDVPSGLVQAKGLTASSLLGSAVYLYGAAQQISFTNCTLVSGGDGTVISTAPRGGNPFPMDLNIIDSVLISNNPTAPLLRYAVSDSNTHIYNSTLTSASPDLVLATCSSSYFEDCPSFTTNIIVAESELKGNIQAWVPALLRFELTWYSTWTGNVVNTLGEHASSVPDVYLDDTSVWYVTQDSWVRALVSALGNVSNIHAMEPNVIVHYDGSIQENAYLGSQTFSIEGGGSIQPYLQR